VVASAFTELTPSLSPDDHWLAYTSNESGINEVYVRPFPGTQGGRWQVSNGGGAEPRWSHDGREVFYLDGRGRLTAARVNTTPTFSVAAHTVLFDASVFILESFHQSYDVSLDGQTFYFRSPRQLATASRGPQLVWVDHWFREMATRLSN
jgi:hypothetical protein